MGETFPFPSGRKKHLLERGHLTTLHPQTGAPTNFAKLVAFILDKRTKVDKRQGLASLSFILTYNCNLS